jgi:PAS domain-containing protein
MSLINYPAGHIGHIPVYWLIAIIVWQYRRQQNIALQQARQALHQNQEQFQAIFRISPALLIITDIAEHIQDVNEAGIHYFQRPLTELQQMDLQCLFELSTDQDSWPQILGHQRQSNIELRVCMQDNETSNLQIVGRNFTERNQHNWETAWDYPSARVLSKATKAPLPCKALPPKAPASPSPSRAYSRKHLL